MKRDLSRLDDLATEVQAVVADVLDLPRERIRLEASLEDELEVDSLRMIEIRIALEERFGIVMPDCSMPSEMQVRSVSDLVAFLQSCREAESQTR